MTCVEHQTPLQPKVSVLQSLYISLFQSLRIFFGLKILVVLQPIRPFDLNTYPEAEDDMEGVSEIPEFDSTRPSGGEIVMLGDSSNGEGEEAKKKGAIDFSLQTRSAEPNTSVVGTEDNVETSSTSAAVHGMDPIGCEIVEALVYISHKEHERVNMSFGL